ncbi:MAG: hypothetical protein GX868_17760 [Actinobacteria bacterium]|nr:hypothetical protein [Actinomycetota bacterium]
MNALPEERLGQLRVAKLRALLGPRLDGTTVSDAAPFGNGAALRTDAGLAAFLVEEAGPRSLGGALVWALRKQAQRIVLIVDADAATAGRLAREATYFSLPIEVERIVGTASVPVAAAALPEHAAVVASPEGTEALLAAAPVDVVVEWGITRAEVDGLEVARVTDELGALRLEVGIGKFDREIAAMMHANLPTAQTLQNAIDLVRRARHVGAPIHPLRDLVPERWLRTIALATPELIGAAELRAVDSTLAPASLREAQPAAAIGTSLSGAPIVAVFTAGVDLDVVPHAADTRAWHDPAAELLICAPRRNILAPVVAVADNLLAPARFVELELPY